MNTTAWVAIGGIAATLIAGLAGPLLVEKLRRETARQERLFDRRLNVYADLLAASARIADNMMTWSAIPEANLKQTDENELDRMDSQARVVASKDVYKHFVSMVRKTHEFNRLHFEARQHHARIHAAGQVDDSDSIKQRMSLGSIAKDAGDQHNQLERAIRREITP